MILVEILKIDWEKNKNYEVYNNSIDQGYGSDDSIFIGYVYILNTPELNRMNKSQ